MLYKYCSICGEKLIKKNDHLACSECDFVNYQNPRPTVTGLILYKNKLLLTKRAGAPFKNWWDLPGGFMEKGENAEEALVREIKEETSLKISIQKMFGTYPGTYPSDFDPFDIVSIVYVATSKKGELQALDDVSESKWFSKAEIPSKIAFDSNQEIIKDFLKIWK